MQESNISMITQKGQGLILIDKEIKHELELLSGLSRKGLARIIIGGDILSKRMQIIIKSLTGCRYFGSDYSNRLNQCADCSMAPSCLSIMEKAIEGAEKEEVVI